MKKAKSEAPYYNQIQGPVNRPMRRLTSGSALRRIRKITIYNEIDGYIRVRLFRTPASRRR